MTRSAIQAPLDSSVAQWERQIFGDRHGVVDNGELENLGDVSLLSREGGHIDIIEQHLPLGRDHEPGNYV